MTYIFLLCPTCQKLIGNPYEFISLVYWTFSIVLFVALNEGLREPCSIKFSNSSISSTKTSFNSHYILLLLKLKLLIEAFLNFLASSFVLFVSFICHQCQQTLCHSIYNTLERKYLALGFFVFGYSFFDFWLKFIMSFLEIDIFHFLL